MKSLIITSLYLSIAVLSLGTVLGQTPCPAGQICNPTSFSTIQDLILGILSSLYLLAIPIVSVMVLWGAFLMVTSAGNPEKIELGKKTIKYAVIGFIFVVLASGVSSIIQDILTP
ncbi:MAG TPA: pilin [Candidatus Paceibacterota bacterium]